MANISIMEILLYKNRKFSMESENSRLKTFRKSFRLTQEEFANALNIKQASISDIERGKVKVSANLMAAAIKKYRLNPYWLVEGKGIMQLTLGQYNLMTSNVLYPVQEDNFTAEEGRLSNSRKDKNLLVSTSNFEHYINWSLNKDLQLEALKDFPVINLPEISGQGRTFQIANDRMLPTLMPGDYVGCTRISYPGSILSNGVYVAVSASYGIIAGRASYNGQSEKLKLGADNKEAGKSIQIPWKEVSELWEVKMRITTIINDAYESRLKALESMIFKGK